MMIADFLNEKKRKRTEIRILKFYIASKNMNQSSFFSVRACIFASFSRYVFYQKIPELVCPILLKLEQLFSLRAFSQMSSLYCMAIHASAFCMRLALTLPEGLFSMEFI